jgi:tRNA(Ile2) C34 agmatinyltransferase TiaS
MPSCPCCGGDGTFLGALGDRLHFRCRACGIGFSVLSSEARDLLPASDYFDQLDTDTWE